MLVLRDTPPRRSVNPGSGTLAHRSLLAGQWEVTESPCPSLEAQALEGGPTLEASGSVWTGLPGTQVYQCLRVG